MKNESRYIDIVGYIIRFLLGEGNEKWAEYASYSDECNNYIMIIPSGFFSSDCFLKESSIPDLPLKQIQDTPLLFGNERVENRNGKIISHTDLIASTFFLITRYEEYVHPTSRDSEGRFPGKESLPFRAGFLQRPIVEEYGKLLRSWLRDVGYPVEEPKQSFSKIYLTHDVDIPWTMFTAVHAVKHCASRLLKERKIELYPFMNLLGYPQLDPQYSFDHLIQADSCVTGAKSVYFIKSGGKHPPQDTGIYIETKQFQVLRKKLIDSGAVLGYHVSYEAGLKSELITEEVKKLRNNLKEEVCFSRNHYLASFKPNDFYQLIQNGITDDFTMAYADVAGFRLGTCRVVNWIDPVKMQVTNLRLHPLTIMDCH